MATQTFEIKLEVPKTVAPQLKSLREIQSELEEEGDICPDCGKSEPGSCFYCKAD